jgi:hypothetical protein
MLVASIVVNLALAAAFGTIVGFFTLSTTSYHFMVLLNVALLGVAGLVGLGFLLKTLGRIAEAERRAREAPYVEAARPRTSADESPANAIVYIWVVIYGLVGMQMGWLLRPFIGHPGTPFEWFPPPRGERVPEHRAPPAADAGRLMRPLLASADGVIRDLRFPERAPSWRVLALGGPRGRADLRGVHGELQSRRAGAGVDDRVRRAEGAPAPVLDHGRVPAGVLRAQHGAGAARGLRAGDAGDSRGPGDAGGGLGVAGADHPVLLLLRGDAPGALIFSAIMFTVATGIGQLVLLKHYRALTSIPERGPRHMLTLWAWVMLYAFVGMQMGWMLRPFVGTPDMPVSFFRDEPFSNAYVVILRLFFGTR